MGHSECDAPTSLKLNFEPEGFGKFLTIFTQDLSFIFQ